MKFPKKTSLILPVFLRTALAVAVMFGITAVIHAQKSITKGQEEIILAGGDLDQCQNGSAPAAPVPCAWVNGNLNVNNSQWQEAQSVPYRLTFAGLLPNTNYTIVLGYDTTEGGIHTLDYLTTWTRNAPVGTNPCAGASASCVPTAVNGTAPIPLDPRVQAGQDGNILTLADNIEPGPDGTNGTPDDDTVSTGVFTFFNGGYFTVAPTSADFFYNGTYAGNSQAFITLSFNTGPTPNEVVLAWSGHIATRFDWGFGNAAVTLTGSPYHMRTAGGTAGSGNQDRSMKIDAVVFPGYILVRKQVNYISNGVPQTTHPLAFGFVGTNWGTNSYQLTDNRPGDDPDPNDAATYTDTQLVEYTTFGQEITVSETRPPAPWSLSDLTCTPSDGGNTGNDPTVNTATFPAGTIAGTATIVLQEANIVSCVFTNTATVTTAAPASISGRVSSADGTGIANARMTLMNASTGETFYALTNAFGYYTFADLPVSDFYVLGVSHKRFSFADDQRAFTLNEDLQGVDFIAN